ncbi:MAG: carboxypeptidase-like regulatory domain-containing protein, partial [Muribaculaceae bacterium]|nr:carboxypeptidase-like regulatory domain-containing protein [Muribaculaceae bacterium]
ADSSDKTPVVGASIIDHTGLITGFTDNSGSINLENKDFPVTVRSMGYESGNISHDLDTLFLVPATYSLNEVVVSPGERPVTRIVTYAREYCSGATTADTLQLYSEYMLEYFFADGKVKGFKKSHESANVLAVRRYARISTPEIADSIFRPKEGDDVTFLSFMTNITFVPYDKNVAPAPLAEGAKGVAVEGKYGVLTVFQYKNDLYIQSTDVLAEHKDHHWSPWFFKMLGLTMDVVKCDWSLVYKQNDRHVYDINDFLFGRYNLQVIGKGKMLKFILGVKEGIDMNCLIEQYPVAIEHLTVEEYNECKKDYYKRTAPFEIPANTEPLPESIESLLRRFK